LYLLHIGEAYLLMGRPQEAVLVTKRFLISHPGFVGGHIILAAAYVECGSMEQAHAEAAEVMKLSPQFSLEAGLFKEQSNKIIDDLRRAGLK
jgi:adenylate cyclase